MNVIKILHTKIHAANAVKKAGGTPHQQDTASLHAQKLVLKGQSGATAVEEGYRAGMQLQPIAA